MASDKQAQRETALAIARAALEAVDPAAAVRRHVRRDGHRLVVGGRVYDLDDFERVLVVGAGKASAPMALALAEALGERLSGGWVNVKYGHELAVPGLTIHPAGHPVPDEASVQGTQAIARLLEAAGERDLVLCAISGGGSALMTLPTPGLSLADFQVMTQALLRSGATINDLNALRKHLDQVKGGGLARLAAPSPVHS
ncbi:MAG: glycerate-2-kinase family protein, partial [Anaerolineae bacterium]|nr:glycerate-2-kinase family protein [Anaerolineae bacterium]